MGNSISEQIKQDTIELIKYINSRLRDEDPKKASKIGTICGIEEYCFSISFLDASRDTFKGVSISIPTIDINRERNEKFLAIERGDAVPNRDQYTPPPCYEMALIKNGHIFYWRKAGFSSCLPRFEEMSDVYDQIIKLSSILTDRPNPKILSNSRLGLITIGSVIKKHPKRFEKKSGILLGHHIWVMHISSYLGKCVPSPMVKDPGYGDENHVEDIYPYYVEDY